MTARLTETLMGAGSWSLELRTWDPAVWEECQLGRFVLLYEGGTLAYVGMLTTRDRDGPVLSGRGLVRVLGQESDGPYIDFRRFFSGVSLLSNGDFSLSNALGTLYWQPAEETGWFLGAAMAQTVTGLDADDVLPGDASQEWDCFPGDELTVSATVTRGGGIAVPAVMGVGQLRVRGEFVGDFEATDLLSPFVLTDWIEDGSGDVVVDGEHLAVGPNTRRRAFYDGFEDDGAALHPDWAPVVGPGTPTTWYWDTTNPFAGAAHVTTNGTTDPAPAKALQRPGLAVLSGERYRMKAKVLGTPGSASPSAVDGEASMSVILASDLSYEYESSRARGSEIENADEWRSVEGEFDVEAHAGILVRLRVFEHTSEFWSFDEVIVERLRGNLASIISPPFAVVPEERLTLTCDVNTEGGVSDGEAVLTLRCNGTGRDEVDVTIARVGPSLGQTQRIEASVEAPSGYDTAAVLIQGADVVGGSLNVSRIQLRRPTNLRPWDAVVPITHTTGTVSATATAPVGTRSVRAKIIAESDGAGWVVDDVSLIFQGTTWTEHQVMADLMVHPQTGASLLDLETPSADAALTADLTLRRMSVRQSLEHFSRLVTGREWRIRPHGPTEALPGTLVWGDAIDLFADRPEHLLVEGDFRVLGRLSRVESIEDLVSRVVTVGAEYIARGHRVHIHGDAQVPGSASVLDWTGTPIDWSRVIEDPTVEHVGWATALAELEAERTGGERQSVSLALSDWRAWAPLDVGDWCYAHDPESGMVDSTQTLVDRTGREVHPWRGRLVERTWELGPDWRAELRRPDGTTVPLDVVWSPLTVANVVIGDRPPEFIRNPQGGDGFAQFLKFRASRP